MEQGEECDCGSEEVREYGDVIRFAVTKNSGGIVINQFHYTLHFDNKFLYSYIFI